MSKMAKDFAKKFTRKAESTRMIICEQAFDVRDGDLTVAVYHPVSGVSFAFIPEGMPAKNTREYDLALRKAIWNEALKHIPSKSEPTDQARPNRDAGFAAQPGLFG